MEKVDRDDLIDRLSRSFDEMPKWAQTACYHGSGTPRVHPETQQPISFKEALELATDDTLETLKGDFEDNGDLLPSAIQLA